MVQDKADDRRGMIYIGVVATLVVGLICGASLLNGSDEPSDLTDTAEAHCHERVREKLKAPSTASILTTSTTGGGRGPWTFEGTVDAENSFGAKIRNRFKCEIVDEGTSTKSRVSVY